MQSTLKVEISGFSDTGPTCFERYLDEICHLLMRVPAIRDGCFLQRGVAAYARRARIRHSVETSGARNSRPDTFAPLDEENMRRSNEAWQATAAYLYVLTLDSISLAWEYLRRNPEYLRASLSVGVRADGTRWGLSAFENPAQDARTANPLWRQVPEGQLRIVPLKDDASCLTFSLWTIPGRKALDHDGSGLLLMVQIGAARVRITMHLALRSGDRFGFAFSSGLPIPQQVSRAQDAMRVLTGSRIAGPVHAVGRNALVDMRTLQTLDAVHRNASQRDVANTLFGSEDAARRWHQDSELRARVRHYEHRGRELVRGHYLQLLYPSRRSAAKSD